MLHGRSAGLPRLPRCTDRVREFLQRVEKGIRNGKVLKTEISIFKLLSSATKSDDLKSKSFKAQIEELACSAKVDPEECVHGALLRAGRDLAKPVKKGD